MEQKTEVKSEMTMEVYNDIFQIMKNQNVWWIGVANYQVSNESFATLEEAKEYIDSKPWKLLINTTCLLMDLPKLEKKNVKNNKQSKK